MSSIKLFRVEDCTKHFIEWYSSVSEAKERALEMVGWKDNQPLADIVDIFECDVSRLKQHLLYSLNHGGWHGVQKKIHEVNQDEGLTEPEDWTESQEKAESWKL